MQRQAKYVIDDSIFHFTTIGTSWDYDNRVSAEPKDAFPGYLYDNCSGYGVRVKRDFQEQTRGKMALEMFFVTDKSADGVDIKLCSSKAETVFEITTRDGKFHFNGIKTEVDSILGETRLKVSFDIDKRCAKFAVNGETAGFFDLGEFCDVARIYLGTSGKHEIKITPVKNKLYVDFIANETFVGTQKYFPDEWALNGDFEICYHNKSSATMNYTYAKTTVKKGSNSIAVLPLEKTEDDVIVEGYFLLPEGADGFNFSLINGDDTVFGVKSEGNEFKTFDGEFLRKFTSNVWQVIRFETKGNDVTVKIDGKACGTFKSCGKAFDALEIFFEPNVDATLSFADIYCEARIDYDDYCPEPKVVRHPEYEVGMNICSMWREGHHFGWDRITHFTDNVPLIGPYDEGSAEVADWEIKFMTEHGITFQHFCWYCPDSMINTPIKRSRMDHALRDGFMNARYSDKMKFIIMWENAGYSNTNPQDFLDYVWPYWCEYFFTDPRYLIINNRPLISLWSSKYVDNWGGPEKAHEIIEFINEDIKKYGFDGVYLMNTAIRDYNNYKIQSEFCDITYAYHYGARGYDLEYQINEIDKVNSFHDEHGLVPFMQTVSVGYNDCAWRGAEKRVPLISLDDHRTALEYVKKRCDERKSDNNWYDKIFMMSTWNEYGEGTYMMPSNIHGFGYLDNVREVFAPESGKCENLLPNENQQKRITYLNKLGRAVIRRHGFEHASFLKEPNFIAKTWDFSSGKTFDEASGFGAYSTIEYTGSSVLTHAVGENQHYSFLMHDDNGLSQIGDATYVKVRMRVHGDSEIRFAFLPEGTTRWNGSCCLNDHHVFLKKSDEYTEILFPAARCSTWRSKITHMRIDNMKKADFEIQSISLMRYEGEEGTFKKLSVNGETLVFDLDPYYDNNGELIVSIDPQMLFFRLAKLYQEYWPIRNELTIASKDVTAVFGIDKETVVVNGVEKKLRVPVTMRDGLPTLSVFELCEIFGFKYTDNNGEVNIIA